MKTANKTLTQSQKVTYWPVIYFTLCVGLLCFEPLGSLSAIALYYSFVLLNMANAVRIFNKQVNR